MSQGKQRPPFLTEWRHHLFPLLLITAIIVALEQTPILEGVESFGFDRMARSYPAKVSDQIVIVEITDLDYEKYFSNTSPLKASELAKLLIRISGLRPKIIGVDLDTDDPRILNDPEMTKLRHSHGFIWAAVPDIVGSESERGASQSFNLSPSVHAFLPGSIALPIFPKDEDGVIRRFRDGYDAVSEGNRLAIASLGCALARHDGSASQCVEKPRLRRFSLIGNREAFLTIDAEQFLNDRFEARQKKLRNSDPEFTPFNKKIVLVGGNYRAARDLYVTPVGEMPGVEVIANAAQSYLPDGKSILEAPWWASGLFDLLIGTGIIALYWRFRLTTAFWLNIFAAPFIAMLASFLAFLVFHRWLAFAPVLVGMMIHELHDHAEHLRKLEEADGRSDRHADVGAVRNLIRRLSQYPRPGRSKR